MTVKTIAWYGLYGVMAVGGFALGKSCGDQRAVVQTKDKVELHEKSQTVEVKKTDVKKDEQKAVAKDVERVVIRYKDGRVETRVVDHTKIETKAAEVRTVIQEKIKTVEVVRVETREKTVTRRPDWIAGVSVGVNVPALAGRASASFLPLPHGLIVGASIDHHIVWGIYGGLRADSSGFVGLGLQKGF